MTTIDIRKMPDVVEAINNVLNNKGIVELKNESRSAEPNVVVVEITRTVKTKKR